MDPCICISAMTMIIWPAFPKGIRISVTLLEFYKLLELDGSQCAGRVICLAHLCVRVCDSRSRDKQPSQNECVWICVCAHV